jgi:hypothetical protein
MDDAFLIATPIAIVLGNIILMLLLIKRTATLLSRIGWLLATIAITLVIWFCVSLPYVLGLADSAASCSSQVGTPGCRGFEELTILFGQTLGNFSILLMLCVLDIIIVLAIWYQTRRPGS